MIGKTKNQFTIVTKNKFTKNKEPIYNCKSYLLLINDM